MAAPAKTPAKTPATPSVEELRAAKIAEISAMTKATREQDRAKEPIGMADLTLSVAKDTQILLISRYSKRTKRYYSCSIIGGRQVLGGGPVLDKLIDTFDGYAPDEIELDDLDKPVYPLVTGENPDKVTGVVYAQSDFTITAGELSFEAAGTAN